MYATILLTASIQGLLLSIALFFKSNREHLSGVYVGLILIVFSIELFFSWGGITGYNNQSAVPFWLLQSYLIFPASVWLFFQSNSKTNHKFLPKHLLLFIPAVIQILINLLTYYAKGATFNFLWGLARSPFWYFYQEILPLALTIIILIIQGIRMASLGRLFQERSNPAFRSHVVKIYCIFSVFCILVISWACITLFGVHWMRFIEIFLTATIFGLAYTAFFKPNFFDIPKLLQANKISDYQTYDDEKEFSRLKRLFEEQTIYTQPKLTVKDLARALGLPSRYVSYLIKIYATSNFIDFVNSYRVKEVLEKMQIEKNKTLLGIAMDAGFNSKSAFNLVFKQHTGKQPSKYLKKS
jgi:AraC-like DNA-binding protein